MYNDVGNSALVRDLRAESRSLGQAWLGLQDEVEQLGRHKALVAQEWRDLEEERERLSKETERFEKIVSQEWFPTSGLEKVDQNLERLVKVNVGGQVFEISAKLLMKDRFSLLAVCCLPEEDSILRPDQDGCFFFDRDWFLFRHVLNYLQTSALPKDVARLRELYHEAGFYCLGSLQREIQTVLADIDDENPYDATLSKRGHSAKAAAHASYARRRRERNNPSLFSTKTAERSMVAPQLADPYGFTARSRTHPSTKGRVKGSNSLSYHF